MFYYLHRHKYAKNTGTVLFFEKKRRQKKLWLLVLCKYYILIKRGSSLLFLIFKLKRKADKKYVNHQFK